jgi:hypothetical protein
MRRGDIVKRIVLVAIIAACAGEAAAQTVVPPSSEQQRRHDGMSIFEGTLTGAVKVAAMQVAKEVRSGTPNASLFTGDARAKGFALEGFGVFLYVEVPSLDLNVSIMVDQLERDLQRRVAAAPGEIPMANRVDSPPSAVDTLRRLQDSGQKYHDAVKLALIDAMLDHSKNLELKADEWLSVAARGSEIGLTPGEVFQITTVVLRVKGSDLADYLAGRLTKEEARQKVEVRQF